MAFQGGSGYQDEDWDDTGRLPRKQARKFHAISDSEQDYDYEEEDEYSDRFQNPDMFLNQFGGYDAEDSEDPDDEDEDENGK